MYSKRYTNMDKDKQIVIRVSKELRDLFNEHCKKHGLSVSKRLRILIERDIDGNRV